MSVDRRSVVGGFLAALGGGAARAQGFAGLGAADEGFAPVVPGRVLGFPRDHGPHPDFRIEWWYLTANLQDASGAAWGAQWTLFRQAMTPGAEQPGWDSRQLWMGHAAVTNAETHRYAEKFARGGVGQAGWTLRRSKPGSTTGICAPASHSPPPRGRAAGGDSVGCGLWSTR